MAKLHAPLFSIGARGKLAGELVYQDPPARNTVRTNEPPSQPNTPAQVTHRSTFRIAASRWSFTNMDQSALDAWGNLAGIYSRNFTAYNAYMRDALTPGYTIGFGTLATEISVVSVTSTTITLRRDCQFFPSGTMRARAGISPFVPLSTRSIFNCFGPTADFQIINLQPSTTYWCWFTGAPDSNLSKTSGIVRATTSP